MTASLAAHGLALVALLASAATSDDDDATLMVDVDVAPPVPEPIELPDEIATPPMPKPDPAPPPTEPPTPEAEGGDDAGPRDAGPRDAGPRDAGPRDAGPRDAGPRDAGPPEPLAVVTADAAPRAADARDAGAIATSDRDAGAEGDPLSRPPPPGAAADFRPYVPAGDKIAVLLRLDRLRGTPWAPRIEAILAPMPDHRSILGEGTATMADLFDVLLISSSAPRDVAATNLAARGTMSAPALRDLIDRPAQPVAWSPARGGALGRRAPSELKLARDERVFLMPYPGWVVLAAPVHLGVLIEPSAVALAEAHAVDADLPPWLARVRDVAAVAGEAGGPIAVVALSKVPKRMTLPVVGELPGPRRVAFAVERAGAGFVVRGTMWFTNPAAALEFERRFAAAREQMLGSTMARAILRNLHAYNAVSGTVLRVDADTAVFATSVSGVDARAGMELAAEWVRRFFAEPAEPPR